MDIYENNWYSVLIRETKMSSVENDSSLPLLSDGINTSLKKSTRQTVRVQDEKLFLREQVKESTGDLNEKSSQKEKTTGDTGVDFTCKSSYRSDS